MRGAAVLHPGSAGGPRDTDFGTRELAALDIDGNLPSFFRPEDRTDPVELMRRYVGAMRRRDRDAGTAFFDDDIVVRRPVGGARGSSSSWSTRW